MSASYDPRLDAMLEALLAFARHDFSKRAPVGGSDNIDAIATGLNMLAEELDATVASRRELEMANAKLVETARMAEIGLLAAGVAHEVNNPAAWVSLALGMIRKSHRAFRCQLEAPRDDELPRAAMLAELARVDALLADCVDGMQRITTVVEDLRNLSRADEESFETIDFDEVVASCCRLASHRIGSSVVVEVDARGGPALVANRGRIAQVVTNLLINASQAAGNAGEVAVLVSARDGGTLLAVEDTGAGVPEVLRARVFEPFFTTKPESAGMGLGLTIVARIAATYGGWARIGASAVRSGARVEVWFPPVRSAPNAVTAC